MSRQQRRAAQRQKQKAGGVIAPQSVAYDAQAGKGKVMIAVPTGGNPEPQFMRAMMFLEVWDAKHHGYIVNGGSYIQKEGTNVSHSRNQLVKTFLEGGWEWLLQVDDDMTFEPDILDRLMEVADAETRPIVGALCFAWLAQAEQKVVPTIYHIGEKDGERKLLRTVGYPRDQLVEVTATGTGFLLVHRRVFIELAKRWQTPWPWFDYSEWGHSFSSWGKIPGTDFEYAGPGDHIGEDITFCLRARSPHGNRDDHDGQGEVFPIFVDTRIKCGHVKKFVVDEGEYDFRHPMKAGLPPTFVVIPVKGQHEYTESLLRQLAAQQGYAGIFVYDNGADTDPYTGYVPDRCEVIPAPGLSLHQMWNLGVRASTAKFSASNIAILNNDLNIGPRFLEQLAEALRSHEELWVVSPNYAGMQFDGDIIAVPYSQYGTAGAGEGGAAGFAFMMKGELFDRGLPLFDEQLHIWYGDDDMFANVQALGGMLGVVKDATVEHIDGGSKTAGDGKSRLNADLKPLAEEDRVYFEKKWAEWLAGMRAE